ncbi:putative Histone-lysine N-methyltransferase setd3 [Hypsibius exemplaris]|uniref:Histone-lysine N-methyltransferase setd3 n=1 Tax=Hypsibius exemplaris TaxID=2072580 RepID=A0A9X6NFC9_HYPEX|nr:putative Histone-lysine N-methyltransferase setd3 [Hypsibius exemplaris]
METLRQQITILSERVKAVEGTLLAAPADLAKISAICSLLDEVDKIKTKQNGADGLSWKRSEHFTELLQWIAAMDGADVSRVAIRQSVDKGFGVYATENAEASRPLLRIPLGCCITPSETSSFVIGQCISSLTLPDNLKMVGILMSEVANLHKSEWKEYLRSLPTSFHTVLHIDREAIKILQGSLYYDDVLRRFCNMCRHYINCVAAVDLSKRSKTEKNKFASSFSFELFRWALDVLMTRGNALPISDDEEPVIALVPLLDMVNHRPDATKFGVEVGEDPKSSACELRPLESVPAGSEIFMSYLSLSVKERLINHGFTTPNEGVIQLQIDLNLSPDNPNRKIFEHLGSTFIQKSADSKLLLLADFTPDGQPSIDSLKILRMAVHCREGEEAPHGHRSTFPWRTKAAWQRLVAVVFFGATKLQSILKRFSQERPSSLGIYFSHSEIMADPNNGQPISNTQTNSNHNAWPNPLMTSYQAPSAVAAMGQAQVVLGQGQVNAQQAGAVALASQAGVAQQGSINAQQSGQRAAQGSRDMAQAEAAQAAQMASLAQLQMATQAIGMAQAAAAAAQVTEAARRASEAANKQQPCPPPCPPPCLPVCPQPVVCLPPPAPLPPPEPVVCIPPPPPPVTDDKSTQAGKAKKPRPKCDDPCYDPCRDGPCDQPKPTRK